MLPVIYSDDFLLHKTGMLHPERPERLTAIVNALKAAPWAAQIEWQLPTPVAQREQALFSALKKVHAQRYIKEVEHLAHRGGGYLDGDTPISAESYDVALLAASAWLDGVDRVLAAGEPAFVLARPPGHHAEKARAMGFCLFSNAAISANYALEQPGINRVAVLDWDVHHGNGTQAAFYGRRDVMYQSVHQYPYYPGTGAAHEVGVGEGEGYTLNVGLPGGNSDADYGMLFEELFLPVAEAYRPQLILVSAGFDPHRDDPIGGMDVTERGFAAMCASMRALAERVCDGKLVLLLEGGYSLEGLSQSVHACVEVLAGRGDGFPTGTTHADAKHALNASREALRPYWPGV